MTPRTARRSLLTGRTEAAYCRAQGLRRQGAFRPFRRISGGRADRLGVRGYLSLTARPLLWQRRTLQRDDRVVSWWQDSTHRAERMRRRRRARVQRRAGRLQAAYAQLQTEAVALTLLTTSRRLQHRDGAAAACSHLAAWCAGGIVGSRGLDIPGTRSRRAFVSPGMMAEGLFLYQYVWN